MPPDLILNQILADFQAAANGYYPDLLTYGAGILSGVALLGCAVAWFRAGFGTDFTTLIHRLVTSIIEIGLVYAVMEHILDWGNAIIDTGKIIGSAVSGIALTPSELYQTGLALADSLISARGWGLWLIGILNLSDAVFYVMVSAIQFVWLLAALIYLYTLLESILLIVAAPIVLCWSGVEFTWNTIYAWAGNLLHVAIRLLVLMLVLAICMREAEGWAAEINSLGLTINLHFFYYIGQALAEGIVLLGMLWNLPRRIAGLIRTNVGTGGNYDSGTEQFVGYAQTGASIALASVTQPTAELGAYVQRKLIS